MSDPSQPQEPTPDPPEAEPPKKDDEWLNDRQARIIVFTILGVWVFLTVAGAFHKYTGVEYPPELHSAFFAAIGLIMVARAKGGGG